ncbi:MAG TPA: hypothetical protein VLH10_23310 [Yinghuangia sp.]|nr:hypothetical protein [Yinghuangia sp.]
MTGVEAHWAYWSKDPGDDGDYRVLACSTGVPAHFTALVHAESPGTPRTEDSGLPGSLPWVAFGSRRDGARDHCSVAVMDWTDDTDWTNRRISATRWMTLPFDELMPLGTEFTELYQAAVAVPLHEGSAATLDLPDSDARPVPGQASGGTAAAMLYWAAGVAALLLEGRVVVTGAGQAGVDERVAAIDAVARMLPYGYRADFTACTWTPVPEQVRQRLCFADYLGDGLIKAPWKGRVPSPSAPVARRYLELLTERLDAGEGERLLHWLSKNAKSRPFSEPGRAVEVLEALTLPELVVTEVRSGQGSADRVLKALKRSGLAEFDSEARRALFGFLFARHDPALYPTMLQYPCGELYEAAPAALHAALAPTASEHGPAAAESEATAITEQFIVPMWDDERQADKYFAMCLSVPRGSRVPEALVATWAQGFAADRERDWPEVGTALLHTPAVGLAAVRQCARHNPKELPRLMALLSPTGGAPWLTVLRWVMDPPDEQTVSARTLAQAVEQCPGVAVQAYRLAALYRSFDAVPAPLWQEWLRIACGEDQRQYAELVGAVTDFDARNPDAGTHRGIARLGLLQCLSERRFAVPRSSGAAEYVRELADACRLLPRGTMRTHHHPSVEILQGILSTCRSQPDIGEMAVAFLVAALDRADDLGADTCRTLAAYALDPANGLQHQVWDALAAIDDGGQTQQRLLAAVPDMAAAVRIPLLERAARTGGPATELAEHWAWLRLRLGADMDNEPVRRALGHWPALRRQPGAVYELLIAVRAALRQAGLPAKEADAWLVGTSRAIIANKWLGAAVSDDLRQAVAQRQTALRREEELLRLMVGGSPDARSGGGQHAAAGMPQRPAGPAPVPPVPGWAPPPDEPPGRDPERRTEDAWRTKSWATGWRTDKNTSGRRPDADWRSGRRAVTPLLLVAVGVVVVTVVVLLVFFLGGSDSSKPNPATSTGQSSAPVGSTQPGNAPVRPENADTRTTDQPSSPGAARSSGPDAPNNGETR